MNNYLSVLKNYVGFEGRARRAEFWQFVLVSVIISIVLDILDAAIGSLVLGGLYSLAVLLPSLAVLARRLHDTNRTALWILIGLIPVVGAIILIVFAAAEGNSGPNQYGPDPKALTGAPASGAPYGV